MINMNTIGPVMIFIIGAIICLDNIKVLFRYYVYGITGSMVPFIGGVLLMTGVCLLLNKNLNYKMAILLFDVTFICWPLAIMRNIILWLIKKGGRLKVPCLVMLMRKPAAASTWCVLLFFQEQIQAP